MKFFTNIVLSNKQITETGIVAALVLLFVALTYDNTIYIKAAGAVLVISLVIPVVLKPVAYLWFGLAELLGMLTSKLLLAIIFFVIVTPVGLTRRLLKKDSLQLKSFKQNTTSAYRRRNHKFKPDDFKHQF